jgi:hypothetical protein
VCKAVAGFLNPAAAFAALAVYSRRRRLPLVRADDKIELDNLGARHITWRPLAPAPAADCAEKNRRVAK